MQKKFLTVVLISLFLITFVASAKAAPGDGNYNKPQSNFDVPGINYTVNYLPSHKGDIIAISHVTHESGFPCPCKVTLLYKSTGQTKELLSTENPHGYDLLGWSTDDSMLWMGEGEAGGWTGLVLYRNGKLTWFNGIRWSEDTIMDYDRGWGTYSDFPTFYDVTSYEEYMKSKTKTTLWLIDVLKQKRVKVGTGVVNKFSPQWKATSQGLMLIYYIGENRFVVNPTQLLKSKK